MITLTEALAGVEAIDSTRSALGAKQNPDPLSALREHAAEVAAILRLSRQSHDIPVGGLAEAARLHRHGLNGLIVDFSRALGRRRDIDLGAELDAWAGQQISGAQDLLTEFRAMTLTTGNDLGSVSA